MTRSEQGKSSAGSGGRRGRLSRELVLPLLGAHDAVRTRTGDSLVELGRRIGRDQVERTPPWGQMQPLDFEARTKATLSGDRLYSYGESEKHAPVADTRRSGRRPSLTASVCQRHRWTRDGPIGLFVRGLGLVAPP